MRVILLLVFAFSALSLQAQKPAAAPSSSSATPQQPTFHTTARLVTIEVVARDHHGQPVTGLTADDFKVVEQIGSKHNQHPQKIAAFRAVTVTQLAAQDTGKVQLPRGVYTTWSQRTNTLSRPPFF